MNWLSILGIAVILVAIVVLFFLGILFILTYLLKKEYWKDVS